MSKEAYHLEFVIFDSRNVVIVSYVKKLEFVVEKIGDILVVTAKHEKEKKRWKEK